MCIKVALATPTVDSYTDGVIRRTTSLIASHGNVTRHKLPKEFAVTSKCPPSFNEFVHKRIRELRHALKGIVNIIVLIDIIEVYLFSVSFCRFLKI